MSFFHKKCVFCSTYFFKIKNTENQKIVRFLFLKYVFENNFKNIILLLSENYSVNTGRVPDLTNITLRRDMSVGILMHVDPINIGLKLFPRVRKLFFNKIY